MRTQANCHLLPVDVADGYRMDGEVIVTKIKLLALDALPRVSAGLGLLAGVQCMCLSC